VGSVGIVLPDLTGIAGLRPLQIFLQQTFTATGFQYLRSDVCPEDKVWYITYSSVGFNVGEVSDCLFEIEDENDNRVAILAMFPDLVKAKTENFFASFWVMPKQKLAARFHVTATNPTCWMLAAGLEFSWSELV